MCFVMPVGGGIGTSPSSPGRLRVGNKFVSFVLFARKKEKGINKRDALGNGMQARRKRAIRFEK